jgi:multiple sugar transport system permease protein
MSERSVHARAPRPSLRHRLSSEGATGVAFILPTLILVGVIVIYPILEIVLMSFSDVNAIAQRGDLIGFANYQTLLNDPIFSSVIIQTLAWTIIVVGVTTMISLPVALALNLRFPGRRFARALLIIPWAASLMINAIIWRWILDGQYSIINATLMDLGIISQPIIWLGTEVVIWICLLMVGILVSIPFTSFAILAGLQSIPTELYEAARVDGAGFLYTLRRVTVPLLKPTLTVTTVLNVIYVFNSFPIIWVMTEGGPAYRTDILITFLYKKAFREGQFGPAAAIAVLTVITLIVFTIGFSWATRERRQKTVS